MSLVGPQTESVCRSYYLTLQRLTRRRFLAWLTIGPQAGFCHAELVVLMSKIMCQEICSDPGLTTGVSSNGNNHREIRDFGRSEKYLFKHHFFVQHGI